MRGFPVLREFLWAHRWRYLAGALAVMAVNLLQLAIPRILKLFADALQAGELRDGGWVRYPLLIAAVAAGMGIGRFGWRMLLVGTARKLEYSLRSRLFAHLQSLSPRFFTEHKTGDLMAHATNDIQAVRMAFGPGIVMSVDAVFLTSMVLAAMVRTVDARLTGLALLPLPLLVLAVTMAGRVINYRFRRVQEAFSDLTDGVQENLSGIRVVKAFGREEHEIRRFSRLNRLTVERNMALVRVWGAFHPLVQFLGGISYLVTLAYGGALVALGDITLGDYVAFSGYLGLLIWPMQAIGWVINMLQRGRASLDRLRVLFSHRPEIQDAPGAVALPFLQGRIEVCDLTFTYPGSARPALRGVSLSLEPGRTLGIMGATGSGKTTLVQLLLRLYDPPPATVRIDGHDIRQVALGSLREQAGYVPQDDFLFSTTVADNIAFDTEAGQEEIERAARLARVHDDILRLPQGYATVVGERGVTLSGGQKQRVAIARALLRNPRLLILDDCLSAVDAQTESQILQELRKVLAGRTSIIVSHRVAAVQGADQIIILEDGRIVEQGTHAELLALRGRYYDVYRLQLLEEEIARAG